MGFANIPTNFDAGLGERNALAQIPEQNQQLYAQGLQTGQQAATLHALAGLDLNDPSGQSLNSGIANLVQHGGFEQAQAALGLNFARQAQRARLGLLQQPDPFGTQSQPTPDATQAPPDAGQTQQQAQPNIGFLTDAKQAVDSVASIQDPTLRKAQLDASAAQLSQKYGVPPDYIEHMVGDPTDPNFVPHLQSISQNIAQTLQHPTFGGQGEATPTVAPHPNSVSYAQAPNMLNRLAVLRDLRNQALWGIDITPQEKALEATQGYTGVVGAGDQVSNQGQPGFRAPPQPIQQVPGQPVVQPSANPNEPATTVAGAPPFKPEVQFNPITGQPLVVNPSAILGGGQPNPAGGLPSQAPAVASPAAGGMDRADRNNNPGNVKTPPGGAWPGQVGVDAGGFAVFSNPQSGAAAADHNLLAKQTAHGYQTLDDIIAGPKGWDPGNTGYAATVAKDIGVAPDAKINLQDPQVRQRVLGAIYSVERGMGGGSAPAQVAQSGPTGQIAPGVTALPSSPRFGAPASVPGLPGLHQTQVTGEVGPPQPGTYVDPAAALNNVQSNEQVKTAKNAIAAYGGITSVADQNTGPAALGIIDATSRLLTGLGARAYSVPVLMGMLSIPQRLEGQFQTAMSGKGPLTPEVKQALIDTAYGYLTSHYNVAKNVVGVTQNAVRTTGGNEHLLDGVLDPLPPHYYVSGGPGPPASARVRGNIIGTARDLGNGTGPAGRFPVPDAAVNTDADFNWQTPTAPAATVAPVAGDPDAGAFQITPRANGLFTDTATQKNTYSIDPDNPDGLVDTAGKKYTWAGSPQAAAAAKVAAPKAPEKAGAVDTDADFGWNTNVIVSKSPSLESVSLQGGQGAINTLAGTAGQLASTQPGSALDKILNVGVPAINSMSDLFGMALTGQSSPQTPGDIRAFTSGITAPSAFTPVTPPVIGPPANAPERIARTIGAYAPGFAFGPEGDASALSQVLTRGANAVVPGAASVAGSESVRALGGTQGQQDLAGSVAGLAGGFVTNPGAALQGAKNFVSPFVANVSDAAARAQAGSALARMASDFPAVKSALAGYEPLVPGPPGSGLTTGQATGDMGILSAEKAAALGNPEVATAFNLQRGAQNQARADSLAGIQTGGDPMAAPQHIRSTIEGLDAQGQAEAGALKAASQAKASAIGGTGNPEDYSADLQASLSKARDAARAKGKELYDAAGAGDLTTDLGTVKATAKSITDNLPKLAGKLDADEASIYQDVANAPKVDKLSELVALKQRVNDAASSELATNGRTAKYARLNQMRDALNVNLSTTIAGNPDAAAGFKAWDNAGKSGAGPTANVAVGGAANQPVAGGGQAAPSGAGGAALPAPGGPAGAAGNQGVSPQISPDLKPIMLNGQVAGYTTPTGETISAAAAKGWQGPSAPATAPAAPTADAAAAGRLQEADAYWRENVAPFAQGPVGKVLASTGYKGDYKIGDGAAAGQFFRSGPTGATAMGDALARDPNSAPILYDYAASTLRREAMNPDGTIDPGKFAKWQAKYVDSILALPADMRASFADAAQATQAATQAGADHALVVKNAQSGAIGQVMNAENPTELQARIGTILGSPTRESDMQRLADATANNPEARAGLRQSVLDYMTGKLTSNTRAPGQEGNILSANQYQTFMRQNAGALAKVFNPDEISRMQNIAADINAAKLSENAVQLPGGSPTRQFFSLSPPPSKTGTVLQWISRSLAPIAGVGLASHSGIAGEMIGAGIGTAAEGLEMIAALRRAGISKVQDLAQQGILNPETYRALTANIKGPLTPQSPAGARLLRSLMTPALVAGQSAQANQQPARQAVPLSQSVFGSRSSAPAPQSALAGVQ